MSTDFSEHIRDRLVVKAVRNIRKHGRKKEADAGKGMYRPDIKLDLERSVLLTESYKQTEGQAMVIRRARALEHILSHMTLYIQDWERIVGNNVASPQGLFFGIDMNWRSVRRIVDQDEARTLLDDDGRKKLDELIEYWSGKSMSDIQQAMFTGPVLECWKIPKGGAGTWSHWSELGVPDYEKVFRVGFRGLIQQARERLEENDVAVPADYVEQKEFLQSVIIALQAAIRFSNRFAEMARERAKTSSDPKDIRRLETIAHTCERVPEHPPRTLQEALQCFFFIHVVRYIEFSTLGIGVRFDKVFGPYYARDLEAGRITRNEAFELLQLLWVKFNELGLIYSPTLSAIYGGVAALQAICIGGVDENGNDITNDMTYLVLDVAAEMKSPEPTIALRYHDGTPRKLLSRAVDVIRTGVGYPAFFNDKAILPLLDRWAVPEKDARDYSISGCVYLELPGKNISHRAYGGFVLPAALLFALSCGMDQNGNQVGAKTPNPFEFRSIGELMDAYVEQVRFMFKRLCIIENTCQTLYERYLPRPYYSALLEGCIEKGLETKKWGYPSPVANICIVLGPTNVADAMTAIKKNVFEDKTVSMEDLLAAIAVNWKGYENIRQLMLKAPKYGNDDADADAMAREVHYRTAKAMEEAKNRFGVSCRGDGSGISATYAAGAALPATPEGRKAGEPLSDATLSPVFGMDTKGPTAVLKSASKISTRDTYNHLLNQKFVPEALADDMKAVFIDYIRAWGKLGISQIQFNVVDPETLKDAQLHPENHPDLLVRVAGYSAYFVDLSRGLQDSIIARTAQCF